jgi:death-on-curing protein
MPLAGFGGQFLHVDVFEMAAAYLFHLLLNHPFLDGNKRTAAASAIIFLKLNNIAIAADQDALESVIRLIPEGKANKGDIANYFRLKVETEL